MSERFSTGGRGIFIAVLIGIYSYAMSLPAGSMAVSFLIAAALQLGVLALRRFVPADQLPQAMFIFETIADGLTVLMFAIGVFGGIARTEAIP